MLTAIRSDGIAVSSTQKTTDIHPTLTDSTNLQSQIALQNGINSGLFSAPSALVSALTTRVAALESVVAAFQANAVTFEFENGTPVPLTQLQLKTGDFPGTAYYTRSGILKIAVSTPPGVNPY